MEFHRYPQVIAGHCNERAFGPPWSFTSTSTCSWVGHPVSGLWQRTSCALFRLALAAASQLNCLTLLVTITRRTVLQKVRGSTRMVVPQLVNTGFQVLFHSPPGVLFTFPSRYCSSIGHQVVFRLGGWSPLLPTGFHVSGGTLDTRCQSSLSSTGLSPAMVGFPTPFD